MSRLLRWLAGWLYFLGAVTLIGGAIGYATNIPSVPDKDDLKEVSGFLVGIRLQKDFNGTDIVKLLYRGDPRVYIYLSSYPQYVEVRDRLGIYRTVDVWIDKNAKTGAGAMIPVWGLVEHNPFHPDKGTVVTYEQIYEKVTRIDRSWQHISELALACGLAALVLAFAIRKAVPYKPTEPTA
jgi:hypothetical protein